MSLLSRPNSLHSKKDPNYTVFVNKPGKYRIITVYGYQDNRSELWLNGKKAAALTLPENTGNWHHWTQATVGEISVTRRRSQPAHTEI